MKPSVNASSLIGLPIGVIAGMGRFPFLVVDGAKRAGCRVTVVGLRGFADPGLAEIADEFRWAGLANLGRWIRVLKKSGAGSVILAGGVRKSQMYGRFRLLKTLPDWTSLRLWFFKLRDKRNDAVLAAVADEFAAHGIIMRDCVEFTKEHLAAEGVLTRTQPSASQLRDAEFGWKIAKELGRLDIGQSVAVKETEVIAVEAIEGTDGMIERAGQLCPRGGWTLVKTAKPNQDMRFDVPTIGPETIAKLSKHGARMLVIEAGKTVIVDREATLKAADDAGIVIVSRSEPNGD
ncbi:MAG: UDP-2,3-diacylglucosamine diphosphatase LpxI [Planctomycetes bacterium]|nr:UDP-2,3-diacylglucosamine diphosphatase LpxI [Planctomycetota bacterium]